SGAPLRLEVSFEEPWPGARLMAISTGDSRPLVLVYVGPDSTKPTRMAEYEGTYQSAEADAIVTLVVRNGKLTLRARKFEEPRPPGDSAAAHGWYPLEAICADAFKEDWVGLLRFTRDSKKQITGFVVSNFAGGVRHLEFQKGHFQFVKN